MGREIVTLQFGNYANYVGAHFWNIQDEAFKYDEDRDFSCLYLEKVRGSTVSMYPRVVLFEEKHNLGGWYCDHDDIKPQTSVTSDRDILSTAAWDQEVSVIQQDPYEHGEFTKYLQYCSSYNEAQYEPQSSGGYDHHREIIYENLDDEENKDASGDSKPNEEDDNEFKLKTHEDFDFENTTKTWFNYLQAQYHQKSVIGINSLYGDYGFAQYSVGNQLMNEEFKDELYDYVRVFTEECDNLQGFHTLYDINSAFGPLHEYILTILEDDFAKRPNLSMALSNEVKLDEKSQFDLGFLNTFNSGLCFGNLISSRTMMVPLFPQSVAEINHDYMTHLRPELPYHSSAIFATNLDLWSSHYRLNSKKSSSMYDSAALLLAETDVQIMDMSFAYPIPLTSSKGIVELFEESKPLHTVNWMHHGLPGFMQQSRAGPLHSILSMRGYQKSDKLTPKNAVVEEALLNYVLKSKPLGFQHHLDPTTYVTPLSYPRFFNKKLDSRGVNISGELGPDSDVSGKVDLEALPQMTQMSVHPGVGKYMAQMKTSWLSHKVRIKKELDSMGITNSYMDEVTERLAVIDSAFKSLTNNDSSSEEEGGYLDDDSEDDFQSYLLFLNFSGESEISSPLSSTTRRKSLIGAERDSNCHPLPLIVNFFNKYCLFPG